MSKLRHCALAGKIVYALHTTYVEDPTVADNVEAATKLEKSTVGIYSSAKAARAALRTCMAKDLFGTDEPDHPSWADFYVGPPKGRRAAVKRLINGVLDAEVDFGFPWNEPWKSDGTVAFNVTELQRENNTDDTDDGDGAETDDDDVGEDDDDESSDGTGCDDGEYGHYYEIEATLIR